MFDFSRLSSRDVDSIKCEGPADKSDRAFFLNVALTAPGMGFADMLHS